MSLHACEYDWGGARHSIGNYGENGVQRRNAWHLNADELKAGIARVMM